MSSPFKQTIQQDLKKTFLNLDEFAVEHNINGKQMPVVIDENETTESAVKFIGYGSGIYKHRFNLFVSEIDFGSLPAVGDLVSVDNKKYVVSDATKDDGLYMLTLEANDGRNRGR